MGKFSFTTLELVQRLYPKGGCTPEQMAALEVYASRLDALDGKKDGTCNVVSWPVDSAYLDAGCPANFPTHDTQIDSASVALSPFSKESREKIISATKTLFPTPSTLCRDMKALKAAITPPDGRITMDAAAMRARVRDIVDDVKAQDSVRSLESLGVDATTSQGREIIGLAAALKRDGLDGLIAALETRTSAQRLTLVKYLFENLPIRPRMTYDKHFPLRVLLNNILHGRNVQKYAYEKDDVKKWRYSKPEYREINEQSFPGKFREWVDKNLLGEKNEIPCAEAIQKSDLGQRLEPYLRGWADFDATNPAPAYLLPETLAILVEGVVRAQHVGTKADFTREGKGDRDIVMFDGASKTLGVVEIDTSDGMQLTQAGRSWLARILGAVHQVIPPSHVLREGRTSELPGSAIEAQNGWRRNSVLRVGNVGAIELIDNIGAMVHELGHYIDNLLITRDCGQILRQPEARECGVTPDGEEGWFFSPKWAEKKEALYKFALRADACMILAEPTYRDTPFGDGHPWDNSKEFFASAFQTYVMNADELARNINNPATPPLVRKYAMETWRFLRDTVFHGVVFTSDGKDPFSG